MIAVWQILKRVITYSVILLAIGPILTACGSGSGGPSMAALLKLDTKRLTFVYFYTPG